MKKLLSTLFLLIMSIGAFAKGTSDISPAFAMPDSIYSGLQGKHHVQGVAVDLAQGRVFFSFTTRLLVTDLEGKTIGSIDGLTGHLGCLAYNPADGRLYASIEYKNDVIGTGIAGDAAKTRPCRFYIAAFDPAKITSEGMSADNIMELIELPEVAEDYHATVSCGNTSYEHRYGCSGIDGIAFAPMPGKRKGKRVLYVAYGIYADSTRTDNDYQVLTCYDIAHRKKLARYFVYTGNTSWGIQNLCYNEVDNTLLAAVYKGIKKEYPNYSLFAIGLDKRPKKAKLKGFCHNESGLTLPLTGNGTEDAATGIRGWNFKYGATGLSAVGNGLFYISHNSSRPEQNTTIFLYRWTGNEECPFIRVNDENR